MRHGDYLSCRVFKSFSFEGLLLKKLVFHGVLKFFYSGGACLSVAVDSLLDLVYLVVNVGGVFPNAFYAFTHQTRRVLLRENMVGL